MTAERGPAGRGNGSQSKERRGEAVASAAAPGIVSILPHDRGGRFQPNANGATLIDKSTLGGNSPDDILGGQYRPHPATTLRGPRGLRSSVFNVH
jgi:hypothetical protein